MPHRFIRRNLSGLPHGDDLVFGAGLWCATLRAVGSASNQRAGRFVSHPFVEVSGSIAGWVGVQHWLWAADDKWCKCSLVLMQSVFQPGFAGQPIELGAASEVRTLLNEENNAGGKLVHLPGQIRMPAVGFQIQNPALPVIFHLEMGIHFQLEGDSGLWFGAPGATSPIGSPFVRPIPVPLIPI